jgi:hypothetical protein
MYSATNEFPRFNAPTPALFPVVRPVRFGPAVWTLVIMISACAVWGGYNAVSESAPPMLSAGTPVTGVIASIDRRFSHNGTYAAEVVATTPLVTEAPQTWTIHVTRRNHRRVANASIGVDAWMPEGGEHSVPRPAARYVGGGDYRIDNLFFSHPGWWNVALVIDGNAGVDSVAFNVVLPGQTRPVVRSVESATGRGK